MGLLQKIKGKLSLAQKRDGDKILSRFKSVTEFLADAVDAAKDNDVLVGIVKAIPWESVQIVGEAAVQALPPLKFVYTLLSKVVEIDDPDELGYLACTITYERSVDQAIRALGWTTRQAKDKTEIKTRLGQRTGSEALEFATFTFETALGHPFVKEADEALAVFADGFHCTEDECRTLIGQVHERFVLNPKEVLATSDRFDKFLTVTDFGGVAVFAGFHKAPRFRCRSRNSLWPSKLSAPIFRQPTSVQQSLLPFPRP